MDATIDSTMRRDDRSVRSARRSRRSRWRRRSSARSGGAPGSAGELRVVRRSLDARKGRPLGERLRVAVARRGEALAPRGAAAPAARAGRPGGRRRAWSSSARGRPGPGRRCASPRRACRRRSSSRASRCSRAAATWRSITRGELVPRSNYCFGEGGAGTYSDGKLYTRAKDRGGVAAVIADLVRFGAPAEIEVDARPHVGSNRLPRVLAALRDAPRPGSASRIASRPRPPGLRVEAGRVRAVRVGGGEIAADVVVLAVGHSARAVYAWAAAAGVALERKPIAVGVRIEHPQPLIDRDPVRRAPPATRSCRPAFYELTAGAGERGVYSFCMCPGGWIVPAATEPDGVVVNGMSLSRRDSPFANSGLVVAVGGRRLRPGRRRARWPGSSSSARSSARRFAPAAGGSARRRSGWPTSSPVAPSDVARPVELSPGARRPPTCATVLPPLRRARRCARGCARSARGCPASCCPDALLIGVETRTSAPVRFLRDPDDARLAVGRAASIPAARAPATRAASSAPRSTARASRSGSSPAEPGRSAASARPTG